MKYNQEIKDKNSRIEFLEDHHKSQMFALNLLSSLGDLQGDVNSIRDTKVIFNSTYKCLKKIIAFDAMAFYTIDESDSDFNLAFCMPASKQKMIEKNVDCCIEAGDFAWALNQNRSVVARKNSSGKKLVFHVISSKNRIRGMFVGLPADKTLKIDKGKLQLLSIIIHYSANMLEGADLYKLLQQQNKASSEKFVGGFRFR